MARRFVSDAAFEQVRRVIPDEHVVFDRLYLNEVMLCAARYPEGRHQLVLGLAATIQRVALESDGNVSLRDEQPVRRRYMLTLSRDVAAAVPKGALYQHQCPACGGPLKDSTDVSCPYCGAALNATSHEWIVTAFQTLAEYHATVQPPPAR